MARTGVMFDFRDLEEFRQQLQAAGNGATQKFIRDFMSEMAWRALAAIKKLTPVNTGLLRNSFQIGDLVQRGDVYEVEVYTDTEYALHVEYGTKGHWTPGRWQGKSFVYDPSADTGIYFKAQPGRFMMKLGVEQVDRAMKSHFERHMRKWLKQHFGG